MSARAAERVLVLGETLVDVVRAPGRQPAEHPGGSPANVALTLGRLGRDVTLATQLADDERGRMARTWLQSAGVDVVHQQTASGRTSTATATVDHRGTASYEFDLSWGLAPRTIDVADPGQAAIVHTGSIATVLEPGAKAVEDTLRMVRGQALVSFDPNARPAIAPDREPAKQTAERLVACSDLVKASEEDLAWYFPGSTALEAARRWSLLGPVVVVLTMGASGSLVIRGQDVLIIPGVPTTVADTIGAGDSFTGAFLDALLTLGVHGPHGRRALGEIGTHQLAQAASWASAAAAITVSRPGSDPPSRTELTAQHPTAATLVAATDTTEVRA